MIGRVCTCLRFQAWNCAPDLTEDAISKLLCTEFSNNEEGPAHNSRFQFRLSLLQADYELWGLVLFTKMPTFSSCHDPLVRPPPHPTHPSHRCLNWERNRQVFSAGKGAQQWIMPPPSPLYWSLFTTCPMHPLPPSFSLSAPSQSHGASGAQSPGPSPGIISSLLP